VITKDLLSLREDMHMRILQIAPPWFTVPPTGYGGTEQVVSLLADGLAARGHDVTLLAAGGSRTLARLITTCEEPPTARLGDATVELAHVLQGYRVRDEFDVVHDHTLHGTALGAMPGGPPVVHTLHGPWTPVTASLHRQISDRVHLVAISHDQAARTPPGIRLAGVVHNGIDVEQYPVTPAKGDHLVFLGRASREKGPEQAIEVARRLGRRLLMAIKVNEPDEHDYFDTVLAPLLGSTDIEVVRVASHQDKCELLGSAAAVLFPIQWAEPFGLVPLEANACGTPVVAFDIGAVREVVADGHGGLLVPPGDLDAFCRAVGRVAEIDPRDCRDDARRFDARHMVEGYEAIYRRLSGTAGGRTIVLDEFAAAPRTPGATGRLGGHGFAFPLRVTPP
jgi:glycosyltransferase involved in cell wall biosynthesis